MDDPEFDELLGQFGKFSAPHVSGYDILSVERLSDDPPNGSVKLLLHAGNAMKSTLTHLKNVLDEWERDVERHHY